MKRTYSSLEDAAVATRDERYGRGSVGIWYARGVELFGRIAAAAPQGRKGIDLVKLARATLPDTHIHLGNIEANDPQTAFQLMDAERWAPGNAARQWIESLGVGHTSMTAGDVIDFRGELLLVELDGFSRIQ